MPDLALTYDDARIAGDDSIFVSTFTGHDASTGHPLEIRGWEAGEFAADGKYRRLRRPVRCRGLRAALRRWLRARAAR